MYLVHSPGLGCCVTLGFWQEGPIMVEPFISHTKKNENSWKEDQHPVVFCEDMPPNAQNISY